MLCFFHVCLCVANPIGLAVAQLASPYIVTTTGRIPMMVRQLYHHHLLLLLLLLSPLLLYVYLIANKCEV